MEESIENRLYAYGVIHRPATNDGYRALYFRDKYIALVDAFGAIILLDALDAAAGNNEAENV